MERRIKEFLRKRKKEDLLRQLTPVELSGGGKMTVNGREYVNLSSNDYLALSSHPELAAAASRALKPVVGSSSSRLMTGSTRAHQALEERVAAFKGKPASLVFNSGYQANIGIISTLCGKDDVIFSDRLNHASIVDGIILSGAKFLRFRHNDTGHLEELLRLKRKKYKNALIVTETVFSMDGDIAPIESICRLKEEYDCAFMVDEAHATGVFGDGGSGLLEETGMTGKVDVVMGTFSKALGGFGSYAAVSITMRDYLVNACRSFIYSTSLPPSIIASNIAALEVIKKEPERRRTLLENADYMRNGLAKRGFNVRGASQIIPIILGESGDAVRMSEFMKEKGYWVLPVRPPTVPHGEARLRISLTFDHKRELLDNFLDDITASLH